MTRFCITIVTANTFTSSQVLVIKCNGTAKDKQCTRSIQNMPRIGISRVARYLTENMASVCLIYGKFWQIFFENGNVFGNIDLPLQNGNFFGIYTDFIVFCNSYFFHAFKFFKFDN